MKNDDDEWQFMSDFLFFYYFFVLLLNCLVVYLSMGVDTAHVTNLMNIR